MLHAELRAQRLVIRKHRVAHRRLVLHVAPVYVEGRCYLHGSALDLAVDISDLHAGVGQILAEAELVRLA